MTSVKRTALFTEDTLPANLKVRHQTRAGVVSVVEVVRGELEITLFADAADPAGCPVRLSAGESRAIGQQPFRLHCLTSDAAFSIEFRTADTSPSDYTSTFDRTSQPSQ